MTHTGSSRTRKIRRQARMLWLTCLAVGCIALASAKEAQASDIGGILGWSSINNNNGNHIAWGLTAHQDVLPMVNVGLYFTRITNEVSNGAGGTLLTNGFHFLMAEANYKLTGVLDGAYIGGKAGLQWTTDSRPNVSSETNFAVGPAAGYDYPIMPYLSVGGQANVLWATSSPSLTSFQLIGLVKLLF